MTPAPSVRMKRCTCASTLTVVAVLLLFALRLGLARAAPPRRRSARATKRRRASASAAWAELIQRSLPGADAPPTSRRRRCATGRSGCACRSRSTTPNGQRIGASESFLRRDATTGRRAVPGQARRRPHAVDRCGPACAAAGRAARRRRGARRRGRRRAPPWPLAAAAAWPRGAGLAIVLVVLFVAVAAGAYPVVRRLTRRLEALQARRRAVRRRRAQPPRRGQRPRRGRGGRRELQRRRRSASRRWCGRTSRCSPTPATSCARRWRA